MSKDTLLRNAVPEDAGPISVLLGELGHPVSAEGVAKNLRLISECGSGYFVVVALVQEGLVGVVSGFATVALHREHPVGRLSVLVVARSHVAQGVGSTLVLEAERRFRAAGCTRIEVTSASQRTEAHEFYRRRGYQQQGVRFAREIGRIT